LNLDSYAENVQGILVSAPWKTATNPDGITIQDFQQIILSSRLMKNGLMFVWAEKEIMQELFHVLEEQYKMYYIENMTWVMLDESKVEGKSPNINE